MQHNDLISNTHWQKYSEGYFVIKFSDVTFVRSGTTPQLVFMEWISLSYWSALVIVWDAAVGASLVLEFSTGSPRKIQ